MAETMKARYSEIINVSSAYINPPMAGRILRVPI